MVFPSVGLGAGAGEAGDGLADNYIEFQILVGGTAGTSTTDYIGYNRGETVVKLTHNTSFDDTVLKSLHLMDDSTDYQNTSGNTAYAIVTATAITDAGDRAFKIWSAPTTDSKTAATQVFDSAVAFNNLLWDGNNELLTSWQVPITDQHFIVIENTSGATPRNINIANSATPLPAIVIEQVA